MKMRLSEDTIIKHITDFLGECDADELAGLVAYIFGGKCFIAYNGDGVSYVLFKDEDYMGEFDKDGVWE
jgi:hypothetical protein